MEVNPGSTIALATPKSQYPTFSFTRLPMPTLGFLKKKRTKDSSGPADPSSPTTADLPSLGGGITHSITSTSSNTLSSHSQAGSERAGGGDSVHASQRPPSQGVTNQQPLASADRGTGQGTASSRSPNQPVPNSITTSQTDGASQPQEEKSKTGVTMTPAQAAAHMSTHAPAITPQRPAPRAMQPITHGRYLLLLKRPCGRQKANIR